MREPLSIQSRNNPRIKAVVSLKDSRYRRQTGLFIVEGEHEISIALQYGYSIETLIFIDNKIPLFIAKTLRNDVDTLSVSADLFSKISLREHPDGILAVCRAQKILDLENFNSPVRPLLILDGLEKPGNHGAILRSASAFGISEIILNQGSLDPYNPNVIRNSRGHSLAFRHYQDSHEKTLNWLKRERYITYVASPEAEMSIGNMKFDNNTAIILGSEHAGVSDYWKKNADRLFKIPMTGSVDSLNVAVSAAIVLYEVFKQKVDNSHNFAD